MEAGEDQARRRQGREAGLPPPRRLRGDRGHGRDGGWAARPQKDARRTPTTRARAAQRRGRHCLYSPAASTVRRVQSNEYECIACTVRVRPASSPRTGRRHQERCPVVEDARPAAPARRGRRRRRWHPANAGTDTGTGTRIYHRHWHRADRTPAPTLAPADADTGTPRTPTPAAAAAPRGAAVLAAPPRPRTASPAPPCAAPPAQPRPSSSRSAPSAARHSRCTASSCSPGVALGFFDPWRLAWGCGPGDAAAGAPAARAMVLRAICDGADTHQPQGGRVPVGLARVGTNPRAGEEPHHADGAHKPPPCAWRTTPRRSRGPRRGTPQEAAGTARTRPPGVGRHVPKRTATAPSRPAAD